MNDVEKIIERIKEGEVLTISCSRYEEIINYRDGNFISTFEDGINEIFKVRNESYVRSNIVRALNSSPSSFRGMNISFNGGDIYAKNSI